MNNGENHENRALIFNMVNGSFVDGYGIRTTIFLKGCPLKCIWCCNPEGQSFHAELNYLAEHCTGCNGRYRCVEACKQQAISKSTNGKIAIDRTKCNNCGACVQVCYFDSLSMMGMLMSPKEVFEKVLREKPFFDKSGGGLTIGGGEATCFPEFCFELIELCHAHDIAVAIDTCGYMVKEDSFKVLLEADLILLDIKGLDEKEHIINTGVSNHGIWETLEKLAEGNKSVIVRIPMIPGYNYHLDQYPELAQKLRAFKNIERIDLLPFHEYGRSKYETLGIEYTVESRKVPVTEQEFIKDIFSNAGFNVQIGG